LDKIDSSTTKSIDNNIFDTTSMQSIDCSACQQIIAHRMYRTLELDKNVNLCENCWDTRSQPVIFLVCSICDRKFPFCRSCYNEVKNFDGLKTCQKIVPEYQSLSDVESKSLKLESKSLKLIEIRSILYKTYL
jgi:hypothetical protein